MNDIESGLPYRPAPVLTTLTVIGLSLFMLLDLLYIPGGLVGMAGAGVFNGGTRDPELIEISVLIRGLSALGQMFLFIITPICFCMLMYRCAKNARALGFTGFSHTPGWVAGWFFIPFAHLIMPYKAIAEIWQSSRATVELGEYPEWWETNIGFLLKAWWAAWIFGTILTNFSSRMSRSSLFETIGMSLIPFAALLQVIAAILCIMVVLKLTKLQNLQAAVLLQTSPDLQDGNANTGVDESRRE